MNDEIEIKDIDFQDMENNIPETSSRSADLNMLHNVKMLLTVELGRTDISIRDILQLGEGSIIQLNKLAGEPVDIFINGKSVAKGEVVVIDENFGVRVTEIISPDDRLNL